LDFSSDALTYCKSRQLNRLMMGSAENLPICDSAYDVILALDIVEHVSKDRDALAEIFRALKKGGSLIVFVPAYQFLWSLQDEISHHKRRYTRDDLKDKILQAGFEIKKISYVNSFLFPVVWLGRFVLRTFPRLFKIKSENDMNPTWTNRILYWIFRSEIPFLRFTNFPFGVSILCVCVKPKK
jgi:SAM-dependent methyltransferase